MAAISRSDLLQEVGISEQQLNSRISDDHLNQISLFLTSWTTLAPFLGLDRSDVEAIEAEGRGEDKRLKMLQRWKTKYAFKATYRKLVDALLSLRMAEHAEKVCRLLQPEATSNDSLHSQVEELQTELSTENEVPRREENETLQTERRESVISMISSLSADFEKMSERMSETMSERMSADFERMSERMSETMSERMSADFERISADFERMIADLISEAQRLSAHQRAASSESPTGLSPHTRLQWRRGADAPEEISGRQAVVMEERMYVEGGYKVFQYDWRRDTWSTLPDCPVKDFGMAQFLGELTTVGGVCVHSTVQSCILSTCTCSMCETSPVVRKLYLFKKNIQQWEEFFLPMPTARSHLTVATRTSSSHSELPVIAVCGGLDANNQPVNTVEVYVSSQWHTAKPLPIPCYNMTSVTINDIFFLLGGQDDINFGTKHCFFVSLDSLIDNATSSHSQLGVLIWKAVSKLPLTHSTAASLRGSLIAIGGYDDSTRTSSSAVHIFTSSGSWERVREGDLPEPRWGSGAVCLPSGELLVAGNYYGGVTGVKKKVVIASIVD